MPQARDFPPFYPTPLMRRLDPRLRRLYALYNRALWRSRKKLTQRAAHVGWTALWPMIAPVIALRETVRYGRVARERSGVGRLRQWWDQVRWSITRGMPVGDYYSFRMHEPGKREKLDDFLWYEQGWRLFTLFNLGADADGLADKATFAQTCERLGLPGIPTVAEFSDGALARGPADPADLPPRDLFVKLAVARSAIDAQRYRYDDGAYVASDGTRRTPAELVAHLADQSRQRRLIVQPGLDTHSALRDLAPHGLATVRMITLRRVDGVVHCFSCYKIPRSGVNVDNMAAGGLAAPVDPDTGALGPATGLDPALDWYTAHPDTGGPIVGRRLPLWQDAVRTALDAHAKFDVPLLGWDMALTDAGPVIVEANVHPGPELIQIPLNGPLFGLPHVLDGLLDMAERAVGDSSAPHAAPAST